MALEGGPDVREVVKQMKSIEEETCWPGHVAAAPGWLRKLFSNVWQTFTLAELLLLVPASSFIWA